MLTPYELMDYIKGPDFPTAGFILGREGIRSAIKQAEALLQCVLETVIEEKIDKARIIVNELPYQVNKARLVEKIAELVREKKIDGITDLRRRIRP